ncbi:transglycosylase domain-containing protein [Halalkalibacter sp. APA_J-10(15)]|uniref:transglycosylase domain-containing protein n=1 Tax=Halalkalibacter sp. APA_J-10(15) TaxID=2933805 RepID=UPI001FF496A0|nr:transglycosylase domain-containing protein [Halalkalibacter sp. APA_J-10(15)]MCK0471300.1 penicillin-binding protein [Halalkalibacter sp. APA_J-10(15)]
MEKENSTFLEKIRGFSKVLHQRTLFRTIGITYQVFWNLFLIFLVLICMMIFFAGGAAAGYFVSLVKDEPLLSEDEMRTAVYDYDETSQVFFANDVYLGELPSDIERHEVSLEDVSEHVIQAIIATEDEYFYEHEGIVPKAIMRAMFQEVANSSLQTGGSTLTQQLIKNQILTNEVSFDRKASEILFAMRLENYLEKDEILEAYLNIVPFGRNASGRQIAGIQAAAQGIFGVDASELSIPQAAYIAGLPQSPFGYTPFRNDGSIKDSIDPSINRMSTVLSRMYEAGYITEEERAEALAYDLEENFADFTPSPIEEYPYLTYEVLRRAIDVLSKQQMEEDGVDLSELDQEEQLEMRQRYQEMVSRDLRGNGYRIHTTVDKDIYLSMQESIQDDHLFGPNKEGKPEQVGAVLLENSTGAIKGFVGGRTEGSDDHYNRATQAYRPNASTMKPLVAYAPALEIGAVQPGIVIPDTRDQYPDGQEIRNFDRQHLGLLSVRESVARSRNVPAVRAYRMVPFEQKRQALLDLGFVLPADAPYESSTLGTNDVTVEQNTNAYATFANGGTYVESYMIERIETADGELIYEHETETRDVFTPQTSYLMIDMMRDVLRGVGTASSLPSRLSFSADWAGKTGTSGEDRDSWFVATNPNVTMSVWVGYDEQHVIEGRSGPKTQQIWANLANAAYSVDPDLLAPSNRFEAPSGIVSRSICSLTGMLPSTACQEAGYVTTDLFNSKFLPSEEDGSLESTRYVTISGKNYIALDSTPSEFTEEGIKLSESFWDIDNIGQYLPDSMRNIVRDDEAPNNGRVPRDVENLRINGDELRWSVHSDNDIIGYRVYRAANGTTDFEPIANVVGNETTSYSISGNSNSYYVTAIDTAGRESARSSIAEGEDYVPEIIEEEEDEEEEQEEEESNNSSNERQNGNANANSNNNSNNGNRGNNNRNDNDEDED